MPFDTMPDEPTHELRVLRMMRALLAGPDSWCKGEFRAQDDETGKYAFCIIGAANEARNILALWEPSSVVEEDETEDEEIYALAKRLDFINPDRLMGWNDNPETSHSEVLARIDAAIAFIEADATV